MVRAFCILLFIAGLIPRDAPANDATINLNDLSFMVGHWVGEGELAPEERWFEPKNNVMSGFFRWPFENGNQVFEFLTFVEHDNGVRFYFKHFDEKIEAWEKDEANIYEVRLSDGTCMEMERTSSNDKVPARIQYCLLDEDTIQFKGIDETQTWDTAEFVIIMKRIDN